MAEWISHFKKRLKNIHFMKRLISQIGRNIYILNRNNNNYSCITAWNRYTEHAIPYFVIGVLQLRYNYVVKHAQYCVWWFLDGNNKYVLIYNTLSMITRTLFFKNFLLFLIQHNIKT